MVQKYLGLQHEYGVVDCIEIIRHFYQNELEIDFPLPSYDKSANWMKQFSPDNIDEWASKCAIKVNLTDAQDYDVMAFRSKKLIIHFGMFLKPTKMLHIEEGRASRIDTLSGEWVESIHAIYRHEKMV
jgi:cell wall-associated NlpC family hydrolase